jgi:hypothetical protein
MDSSSPMRTSTNSVGTTTITPANAETSPDASREVQLIDDASDIDQSLPELRSPNRSLPSTHRRAYSATSVTERVFRRRESKRAAKCSITSAKSNSLDALSRSSSRQSHCSGVQEYPKGGAQLDGEETDSSCVGNYLYIA